MVFSQVNNQIKTFALQKLQERYPDFTFQISKAELVESKHIILRNVEITAPNKHKLINAGEVVLDCSLTLQTLYQKNVSITRISVKNVIVSARRSKNGKFEDLEKLCDFHADTPISGTVKDIEFEDGIILYSDDNVHAEPLKIRLEQAKCTKTAPTSWTLQAAFQSDQLRRLNVNGAFDESTKRWNIDMQCKQLDWDSTLTAYVPHVERTAGGNQSPPASGLLPPALTGRIDFSLQAFSDEAAQFGCRFRCEGNVSQGYVELPELNRTISGINARISLDNDGFRVEKLTAIGDASRIAVSYAQKGLLKRQSAELTANIRGLSVDAAVAEAVSPFLNEKTQRLLEKFDFSAVADVHAELRYVDNRWIPKTVSLQVADLAFAYQDFPYKAERLSGTMYIEDNAAINFRFVSRPEDLMKVTVEGHYRNLTTNAAGSTEIIAENVLIDDKLIASLPEETEKLALDLHPTGKLNGHLVFKVLPASTAIEKEFDIQLQDTAAKYERFPYPVNGINGLLQYRNGTWSFENITAANGNAVMKCSGALTTEQFVLHVLSENLPIDTQLADAVIEPEKQQLLKTLNIQGNVNVQSQVVYHLANKRIDLRFQATPCVGLSVCPDKFPYRVQNVAGNFEYNNGVMQSRLVTAINGDEKLQTELDCRTDAAGQYVLTLSNLRLERLAPKNELLSALPSHLRSVMTTLGITQPFSIAGSIRFINRHQAVDSQFNLAFLLQNNDVQLGFPAEHVVGAIRLAGESVNNQLRFQGDVNLESMTVYNMPVTHVQGHFAYNQNRLQIGIPANRLKPGTAANPMTADFFGGKFYTEGLVLLSDKISYSVNSALYNADLSLLAKQFAPSSKRTAGTLNCTNINVQGIIATPSRPMSASGTIELRDADIYEAPAMLRLLRELGIRERDPNAGTFNSADVNFRMSGDQVNFDPIIFEGNLFSIFGSGSMSLESRSIDLMMKTRLGNRRTQIPLISGFIGGVGDQFIQLKIAGPIDNPTVARVTLPNLL
ncbi:hypothetical protein FACS1894170_03170 [Planctomycetales bacterium]|nr:hypothetical protein FACS1894170_03170 [Planctomycetales bacterium]